MRRFACLMLLLPLLLAADNPKHKELDEVPENLRGKWVATKIEGQPKTETIGRMEKHRLIAPNGKTWEIGRIVEEAGETGRILLFLPERVICVSPLMGSKRTNKFFVVFMNYENEIQLELEVLVIDE